MRCPFKKLMSNIRMSSSYGAAGARTEKNPKLSGRIRNSNQSTKRHEVEVNVEDLKEIFEMQLRKCYWLDIELNPNDIFTPHYPLAMSADRLDNDLHYTKENIVICCRFANLGRGSCKAKIFREILIKIKPTLYNPIESMWEL